MSIAIFRDQRSFMRYFGQPASVDTTMLYKTLVEEEHGELQTGIANWIDARKDGDNERELSAVTEIADAVIDSIYVLTGLLHGLGLDPQPLWDEVHRSNIDKLKHKCKACDGTGKLAPQGGGPEGTSPAAETTLACKPCTGSGITYEVRRREDGKVLKPDGWRPPNLEAIVHRLLTSKEPF